MKTVSIKRTHWDSVLADIRNDYPLSVFAIRTKMKSVLGFTHRHGEWGDDVVYLDFYSENKRTMFLLKYSELITRKTT